MPNNRHRQIEKLRKKRYRMSIRKIRQAATRVNTAFVGLGRSINSVSMAFMRAINHINEVVEEELND